MRKLVTLVCFCLIPLLMSGKIRDYNRGTMLVEADCLSLLNLGTGVHFSHSFADKWSTYAGCILMFGKLSKGRSDIEQGHYEIFNENLEAKNDMEHDLYSGEIAIQYWPQKAFNGHFISVGIRTGDKSKTDCLLEYGYRIPIWKGLGASISLKTGIIELIKRPNTVKHIFKISIGYDF